MKFRAALLAAALSLSAMAAGAPQPTRINGWISDSMCGARHTGTGKDCVKKCISMGASPVFVDEPGKTVWKIDNPEAVKGFYGDHVTITATADTASRSVRIDKIAAAR